MRKEVEEAKGAIVYLACIPDAHALRSLAWELANSHRTCQQMIMRHFIIPFIEAMANNGFDDRNQKSVELCRRLLPMVQDVFLPLI